VTKRQRDPGASIVAVLIMSVSLAAAGFAYLQTQADNNAARATRRAEGQAVEVLNQLTLTEREIAQEVALFGYANDLAWVSNSLGQTASMGLDYAQRLATAYTDAYGWSSSFSSVIGGEYQRSDGFIEWTRFVEESRRAVYRASETEKAHEAVASAWGSKASAYVAVITVLAASLFLLGLTSNIASDARRTLAFSGTGLALIASLWGLSVFARDVPEVSDRAIQSYVDGLTINLWASEASDFEVAERSFTEAIAQRPDYSDAYFGRGFARFRLDLLGPDGPQGSAPAEADFLKVLEFDPDNGIAWGNIGAVRFWMGDLDGSIAATRRALDAVPEDPILALNLGFGLAAAQDPGYPEQLAAIRERFTELPAWLRESTVANYMVVLDLAVQHRPTIAPAAARYREAILEISHEISVGRRFFGSPTPAPIDAAFPSLVLTANDDGTGVLAEFTYTGMSSSDRWLYRTYVDGVEWPGLSRVAEPWPLPVPDGDGYFEITYDAGLRGSEVRVEIFVEGNLLAAAGMAVP